MAEKLEVGMRFRRMCEICGVLTTQTITEMPDDPLKKGALVGLDCNGGHTARVARYILELELGNGKADVI